MMPATATALPSASSLRPFARLKFANHRYIYSQIEGVNKALKEEGKQSPPAPVYMLVYAAQFMVCPTLVRERISDLLEILANLETIRLRAVEQAAELLESCSEGNASAEPIPPREQFHLLAQVAYEDKDLRQTWVDILYACSQLYVYHLCKTGERESVQPFLRAHLHCGPTFRGIVLPEDAQQRLRHLAARCNAFEQAATEWERSQVVKYNLSCEKSTLKLYSNAERLHEFQEEVPFEYDGGEVEEALVHYLEAVERAQAALESVISGKKSTNGL